MPLGTLTLPTIDQLRAACDAVLAQYDLLLMPTAPIHRAASAFEAGVDWRTLQ